MSSVIKIAIVAALALGAGTTVVRIAKEVIRTDLATGAGISLLAVAQHVIVPCVQGAAI